MPDDVIVVPPPPRQPDHDGGGSAWTSVLPMAGSVASIVVVAGAGGAGNRALLGAGAFLVSSLAVVALQLDRQRSKAKRRLAEHRSDYLELLRAVRAQVRTAAAAQHLAGLATHPPSSALAVRAAAGLPPRQPGDPSYLSVRVGSRSAPLTPRLLVPDAAVLRRADPALADAVRRFAATHATVPAQPVLVDLREHAAIRLGGDVDQARAIVCEAIACHGAEDLRVLVAADGRRARDWAWLDWLPAVEDAAHTLVVAAGGPVPTIAGPATVLDLEAPAEEGVGGDHCSLAAAEAVARRLTGRVGTRTTDDPLAALTADRPHLCASIGRDSRGRTVDLDLREAAVGGVGPHGLVVGATGSGKSELLRTLVLGLALTHSTDDLNLVLVDFKGGATFAGLAGLPHVSASITNLADDVTLVDRMGDALLGELERRQQLLRDAGASSREEYAARHGPDPLPSLVIIVDEFSELLGARPEFIEVFVSIGRLGRSLGMHLLLATQRLEEGRLRGLESHLSYRLALRTFSAAESRAAIGVGDAHELPPRPGTGLLRTGSEAPVRFQAHYVSDRLDEIAPGVGGDQARRIWLPPLDQSPALTTLSQQRHQLEVGLVDRPRAQCHDPLVVDLSGAGGHLAVVGAPRSGASTLIASVITAMAITRGPDELELHLLDLTGGLAQLADLPQVASIAGPAEPALVRRIVRHVDQLLTRREAGSEARPEVVLVVDGWSAFCSGHPDLSGALPAVAARGLAQGVHLVAGAHRWSDFRSGVRDLFGSRLELRLGDPLESMVDRRLAAAVPAGRPGRGVTAAGEHFLAAVPDVDALERIRRRWPVRTAPRLRALPVQVVLDAVPDVGAIRLGLDEQFEPAALDGHLVVRGPSGSGRSSALRLVCKEIQRVRTPAQAQVLAIDGRRSLLGEVDPATLLLHRTGAAAVDAVRDLATHLTQRLPGPEVTATRLRARDWWQGPEVWLVVDDLDLLAPSPLGPLVALLPHAHEVGLHVVVAARETLRHDPTLTALADLGAARLSLDGTPAGRGRLDTPGADREIQVVWTPPAA